MRAAGTTAGSRTSRKGSDETQAFGFSNGKLKNTVTVAGCGQWPNAVPDVLQLDTKANVWSVIGALNEARRNHAGVVIGSTNHPQLYIVGGYSADGSTVLTSAEIGTPGKKGLPHGPFRPPVSAGTRVSVS